MEDLDFTQDAETPKYLSKKGVYKLKVNEYKWSKEIGQLSCAELYMSHMLQHF